MVRRWRCRHCDFTVWSAGRERTVEQAKTHLVSHYRDEISKTDFGVEWSCPYCEQQGRTHDQSQGYEKYTNHLFSHAEALLESGVHVADDVDGTGSVLVLSDLDGPGAENARIHFLSPCEIAIFVTTRPADRIRLLRDKLEEWPAWTVLLTTREAPLGGVAGTDLSSLPIDVVQLDSGLGLGDLGQTISRVLDEQENAEGKISFEFDILSEIISKFELKQTFKFLHVLDSRLRKANALSHFYVDPSDQPESTLNVLDDAFDMRLTAEGDLFISEP